MQIDRNKVVEILRGAGVYRPTWTIKDNFTNTHDRDQIANEYWPAWVQSLPPELRELVQIGGGKSIWRPVWLEEVFDCDNHTADFRTYVSRCCGVHVVKTGIARGGSSVGSLSYDAVFKAGNRRVGGHDTICFIDHELRLNWFEPADGNWIDPLPIEIVSVWGGDLR